MIAVIDASAAVRTLIDIDVAIEAALEEADALVAPDLIVAEVCSAFRKYVKARVITHADAVAYTDRALTLIEQLVPMEELYADVLALSRKTDLSTYDLFYVALALQKNAMLITSDRALSTHARKLNVLVQPGD